MQNSTNKESVKNIGFNTVSTSALYEKAGDVSRDFHNFVNDVEALLRETANVSGQELVNVKAKLNERISQAKKTVEAARVNISDRATQTAESANNYVHEKPWPVIGASAAAGLLIGYLLSSKK